ncbi:MAG TPA: hypothetical protein VN868_07505 [Terriglobales bacterium]|nr:hypothetical protein [Terriglobales bacterium]
MIGPTISHYRILQKLGGGGMGVDHRPECGRRSSICKLSQARQLAGEALHIDRGREALPFAALASALAGDSAQATSAADELSKRFPLDTIVNNVTLPAIHAGIEISRGNPAKAIESLQVSTAYEFGWGHESRPTTFAAWLI